MQQLEPPPSRLSSRLPSVTGVPSTSDGSCAPELSRRTVSLNMAQSPNADRQKSPLPSPLSEFFTIDQTNSRLFHEMLKKRAELDEKYALETRQILSDFHSQYKPNTNIVMTELTKDFTYEMFGLSEYHWGASQRFKHMLKEENFLGDYADIGTSLLNLKGLYEFILKNPDRLKKHRDDYINKLQEYKTAMDARAANENDVKAELDLKDKLYREAYTTEIKTINEFNITKSEKFQKFSRYQSMVVKSFGKEYFGFRNECFDNISAGDRNAYWDKAVSTDGSKISKVDENSHSFLAEAFNELERPVFMISNDNEYLRDLAFKIPLEDQYIYGSGTPYIILMCKQNIEERGLEMEGLYRQPANQNQILELKIEIEKDINKCNWGQWDVRVIGDVFKLYLRELPEALFKFPSGVKRSDYSDEKSKEKKRQMLKDSLKQLSPVNRVTLRVVIEHLNKVASNSSINKMTRENLAVVFNPPIFHATHPSIPTNTTTHSDLNSMNEIKQRILDYEKSLKDGLLEDLMDHYSAISAAEMALKMGMEVAISAAEMAQKIAIVVEPPRRTIPVTLLAESTAAITLAESAAAAPL